MSKQDGWLNNIGRMIKKKPKEEGKPAGYCLVFERRKDKDGKYIGESPFPLTINEGDYFQLRKKEDDLAGLVRDGKLSQEIANEICKSVKFEISRAPLGSKENKEAKETNDEVNF